MQFSRPNIIKFVRSAGQRYWSEGRYPEDCYGAYKTDLRRLGNSWEYIELPNEYADLGVNGRLLVDSGSISPGDGDSFFRCDWYVAAFSFLSGALECRHEKNHGSIQSFSFLLNAPDAMFEYAWANRILLLLRRMEATRQGKNEEWLFGPLPEAEILLSHDVDALDKTVAVRIKQAAFEGLNIFRCLSRGQFKNSWRALVSSIKMALLPGRYFYLDTTADAALEHGVRATYYLHARADRRSLKSWFFDPGYKPDDPRILAFVKNRSAQGFRFGLHPSYDSYEDMALLTVERERLEAVLRKPVKMVRQHWLRFSWRRTWESQEEAGLSYDATLGFNDRPGFRASAALDYQPWDSKKEQAREITMCPLLLMDSQLFSYTVMEDDERLEEMRRLINEVRAVHGVANVLWHPHTLSHDYNWGHMYSKLLHLLSNPS